MKKSLLHPNKKGFTLVELLVTMGILGVVLVMIAGLAGYTAGRLRSNQNRVLNDSLRNVLDIIGQKMYNANTETTINGNTIYGFKVINNMLVIVSSGDDNSKTCTYFGKKDETVSMKQTNCSENTLPTETDLASSLTPSRIKIKDFIIDPKDIKITDDLGSVIPTVNIKVKAEDRNDVKNIATLKSTFSMDYETIKSLSTLL